MQSASLYDALKCFLHGFLTVAGAHVDQSEAFPFDALLLDNATREIAAKVPLPT